MIPASSSKYENENYFICSITPLTWIKIISIFYADWLNWDLKRKINTSIVQCVNVLADYNSVNISALIPDPLQG